MSGQVARGKPQFKDYCLILQVHPEADGAMIDAAYWHLAKRCNQAGLYSPQAAQRRLDELNEAYNVLGSPDRRDEYMKVRAAVLGEGALPVAPPPPAGKLPLAVMERQRLKPREVSAEVAREVRKLWGPSAVSSAFSIPVVLGLAVAAFLAGAPPETIAALLILGLLFTALPLALPILRLRPAWGGSTITPANRVRRRSPRLPRRRRAERPEAPASPGLARIQAPSTPAGSPPAASSPIDTND